ncbi:hypothetical protein [Thioclava sp. DLFJ4-1]|uniref:hypothetical protein n=1 Tax=Thioclava sp. DLFJ4-1 TaxID=1915313 RepID=UPI001FEE7AF3|nr:hypothetical protein [Thioclava sp. DLFJ4-1]
MAILFVQRIKRGISLRRRGAATSHNAIAANTPKKAASRIVGSAERIVSVMRSALLLWRRLDSLSFNYSIE